MILIYFFKLNYLKIKSPYTSFSSHSTSPAKLSFVRRNHYSLFWAPCIDHIRQQTLYWFHSEGALNSRGNRLFPCTCGPVDPFYRDSACSSSSIHHSDRQLCCSKSCICTEYRSLYAFRSKLYQIYYWLLGWKICTSGIASRNSLVPQMQTRLHPSD